MRSNTSLWGKNPCVSVCSVDKKNTVCDIKITTFIYLNTTNSIQGKLYIHLTANFIQHPAIFRSLLDHFSFVPRSSLVVLSFVIR